MKKLAVFALMMIFLANTFVVSAWAKPCMTELSPQIEQSTGNSAMGDMPCHEKKGQDQNKHCEGVCLCFHVSTSQTPVLQDFSALQIPLIASGHVIGSDEAVISNKTAPPRRPPKLS